METLIKELERVANEADKLADKKTKENDFSGASMQKGYSIGIQFAINALKFKISVGGLK